MKSLEALIGLLVLRFGQNRVVVRIKRFYAQAMNIFCSTRKELKIAFVKKKKQQAN